MRIASLASLAFPLLLAAPALAQNAIPIGYPSDTARLGIGNLAPFGLSSSPTFDEVRWQQLIPATFLPTTPGLMTGLAVNCQSSSALVTYTALIITLSHTTATTLGNSFAGNLPAPIVVLNGTNHPIQWANNQWVTIPFTFPFVYNGTDNLVVSIQKVYDRVTYPVPGIVTHQTSGPPHRADLGQTKYTFTIFGGGGSTTDVPAVTGSNPLGMRLFFIVRGTTTIASVSQPTGPEFSINTSLLLSVWSTPGSVFATVIDSSFRAPVSLPIFAGRLLVLPTVVVASGTITGSSTSMTIPIPNNPAFIGAYFVLQSATANAALTNLTMTNAADFFVNS